MFENWTKPQDCESATCLEVVRLHSNGAVALRPTPPKEKLYGSGGFWVSAEEFAAFIAAAKAGFYDGLLP